jgi:hypothetical protein
MPRLSTKCQFASKSPEPLSDEGIGRYLGIGQATLKVEPSTFGGKAGEYFKDYQARP